MDDDCEKRFASCKVNWNIENFCFAHPIDDWSIFSSDFVLQGLQSVKWRLSLELEEYNSAEVCTFGEAGTSGEAVKSDVAGTSREAVKSDVAGTSGEAVKSYVAGTSGEAVKSDEASKVDMNDKIGLVSVYLEKLPILQANNAENFPICVNWEMQLTARSKVFGPFDRSIEFGDVCKHGQIGIATTNEIFENLSPYEPDTFLISLCFVAFNKNKTSESEKISRGLLLLSEDLKRLKDMEKNYSDITLKVNDKYIQAHRVILSRNDCFRLYLNGAQSIIQIPNFDYKTLNAFVNFLYSGKVDCLEEPSLSMIRCMKYFECDALEPYYIPEQITLNSKIKVEAHDYNWHVDEILDKNEFEVSSPPIRLLYAGTTWHLIISSNSNDLKSFISIFARIADGNKPKNFCLEFALESVTLKRLFARRLVKHIPNNPDYNSYENLGFDDFVTRGELINHKSLTLDNYLRVLFKVRTSDCSQESSIGCHAMSFVSAIKSISYNMSAKMLEIFENNLYSDITIRVKDLRTIKAHKCILVARSPGFKRRIESELSDNILMMWDIDYETLKLSLRYMYTGSFDDEMKDKMKDLYYSSSTGKLDIPSLFEESLQYLKDGGGYIPLFL